MEQKSVREIYLFVSGEGDLLAFSTDKTGANIPNRIGTKAGCYAVAWIWTSCRTRGSPGSSNFWASKANALSRTCRNGNSMSNGPNRKPATQAQRQAGLRQMPLWNYKGIEGRLGVYS